MDICPIAYSDQVGRKFISEQSENQNKFGQYFTPVEIAQFMAEMLAPINDSCIHILDPGAGSAVLAAAVIKSIVTNHNSSLKKIFVNLYEIDPALESKIESTMIQLKAWCLDRGVKLQYEIRIDDFILSCASVFDNDNTLFKNKDSYDVIVSNPPYFKIGKDDPRSRACGKIIFGQPNIYALFMALSAAFLKPKGQLLFITPRSFASGQYFKAFRSYFMPKINIKRIHQFISRADTFDRDSVLQENIITHGIREPFSPSSEILISNSNGRFDLNTANIFSVKRSEVVNEQNDFILSLPSSDQDIKVLKTTLNWTNSLEKMGLKVSTGPVVPFRSTVFLHFEKTINSKPLYWIQHIKPMETLFPLPNFRKQQWFEQTSFSQKLLVKNQNMILMRRFSPKEDFRRLTVAPFLEADFEFDFIALENHLNYIYMPNGAFTNVEVVGLSAFLNSKFFDGFFRISNGNTQVSATELKSAPLPPKELLIEIGRQVLLYNSRSHSVIDKIVDDLINSEAKN